MSNALCRLGFHRWTFWYPQIRVNGRRFQFRNCSRCWRMYQERDFDSFGQLPLNLAGREPFG